MAGLTPVVLTSDTLVTNHGYRNGAATSLQSVLQAGTAVLVDATGTPRVKCNCGNPLAPPQAISLRSATIVGPPWSGYVFTQVTFVQPGGSSARLTLTNTSTGDAYTQDTGSTSGTGLWVATQIDGTDTSSSTTVLTSADGATWRTAADLPGESLRGLVWAHGRWIGVSSGNGFEGTHVLESRDARAWQQVGTVAGAQLSSIAYGKGRWVASGLHWSAPLLATGTPHSELMTYSSTDARSWNGGTAKGIDAYANGSPLPVTFAGGSFFAVATTDEFTSGGLQGVVWTSTDGSRWSSNGGRPVVDGTVSLASGPRTFVLGGSALAGTPLAVSTDARAWSPAPLPGGSLPGLAIASIGYGGGRFLAATQGTSVSGEVVASPDGRTWTAIGSAAGSATLDALAYGRSLQAEATTAPTTAAGSPPCTKQALQTVFSDEPDDDMNVAMVDSTDPLVCVNGWTALHYGNQGRYLLAVFRANGSVWQTYGYTHEPDGGEGWRETAPSVCAQPGFPQELHPIVCPGR